MDILRGGAATAIYGSRGANGVVLITTKGAGTGGVKTQFPADAYVIGQRPYGLPTMMNPQQYLEMLQAAARYAGSPDDPSTVLSAQQLAAYTAGQATDWQKLIERTGQQRSVHIGMNGISENTRFNLSGNYFDQTGTAVGFDFNRLTGNASVDHVQGRLRLGLTASYVHSLQATALGDGLWGAARQQTGFGSPYDANGLIVAHPDGDALAFNPLKAVQGVRNDVTRDRFFAWAFGTFQLLDGVNLRVNFGPDYTHQSTGHYEAPTRSFPGTPIGRRRTTSSPTCSTPWTPCSRCTGTSARCTMWMPLCCTASRSSAARPPTRARSSFRTTRRCTTRWARGRTTSSPQPSPRRHSRRTWAARPTR